MTLLVGTSSFSSKDWVGPFYPPGTKPAGMLAHYATRFSAVEIDSTFYGTPRLSTVQGWRDATPPGFSIATKMPELITHERLLADCAPELLAYCKTMEALEDRRGPILIQLRYFKKGELGLDDLVSRLEAFLPQLPREWRFALEVRNKAFLKPRLLELLSKHRIALALIDHPYMPRPGTLFDTCNPLTTDWTYVRWLGDRYAIEEMTKTWDKQIVPRWRELLEWREALRKAMASGKKAIWAFANNHFSGHAPADADEFARIWREE